MKTFRCFLFASIVTISTAAFASAGEIQGPGKSEPAPTPTPTALTSVSTSHDPKQSTSTEETSMIVWQDTTTILVEILLAIF